MAHFYRGGDDQEEGVSSQGEFTVKEIGQNNKDTLEHQEIPHSVTKNGVRYYSHIRQPLKTQILQQQISKENHFRMTGNKIDKEVGPESDKNMSVTSSNIYLDGSINVGGGEIMHEDNSYNFFNSRIVLPGYMSNIRRPPNTTAQSPHYDTINDNNFLLEIPKYPSTNHSNRTKNLSKLRANMNFSMNINKNNNHQVFTT